MLLGESHILVKVYISLGIPLYGKRTSTNDKELRDGLSVGGLEVENRGKEEKMKGRSQKDGEEERERGITHIASPAHLRS